MNAAYGTGRAFARVALAGNPSDGYGGRTLAVVVRDFAARASASPAADQDTFAEPGPGGEPLMRAALERFRSQFVEAGAPVELKCTTDIPRELGLGGSSAIVIACLRALCDLTGAQVEPDEMARMALAVENEDLGIAAGLQDRIVQTHETLVEMDFGGSPTYENLDPALLPSLFVAWHPEAAASSGVTHSALRARYERGEPEVLGAMSRLADLASTARQALLEGDATTFGRCLDGSFDERLRITSVDPLTRRMVEVARSAGAAANSAGSGGAIVGTLPGEDESVWRELRAELDRIGAAAIRPATAP